MSRPSDVTVGHLTAGVIGLSLLRHWYVDGRANDTRLAELRDLVASAGEHPPATPVNPANRDVEAGYAEWAGSYDGPNPMIGAEEAAVRPILAPLAGPGVRAFDGACGTGRHAAYLADRGCVTTGVDQSEAMLAVARAKVPGARFDRADLRHLPCRDEEFDLAVVSLALCHLPDPTGALAELRRVLRPGGTLVIADPHPDGRVLGGQAFYRGGGQGGPVRWVRNHCHTASTWLRAFRAADLAVVDCQEPTYTDAALAASPSWPAYPEATRTAMAGLSILWVWTLRR